MESGKRLRRCCSGDGDGVGVFPIELIRYEILSRLPVKTLLRFKSVCKLWCSVIKSPDFIDDHYHHRSNRSRLLFHEQYSLDERQLMAFNPNPTTTTADPRVGNSLFSCSIGTTPFGIFVRPVKGFFLVVLFNRELDRCRMSMLNPAIRQFRFLNDSIFSHPVSERIADNLFGFGICKNSHKVVWLSRQSDSFDVVAQVYTVGRVGIRDKGWRIIDCCLPQVYVEEFCNNASTNTFMDGKCYWVSTYFSRILVFDMVEEVFRELDPPVASLGNGIYRYFQLASNSVITEVQGCGGEEGDDSCLGMFVFETEVVHMAVMNKREEWRWILRVGGCVPRAMDGLASHLMQLLFRSMDCHRLLLKGGMNSCVVYDPKTKTCERFDGELPEDVRCFPFGVFSFKESLFAVDGGIQVSNRVLENFYTFYY